MFKKGIAEPAFRSLEIIRDHKIFENFYLAGGTAAAIIMGHRLSIDLDFFTADKFDSEVVLNFIDSKNIGASKFKPSKNTLYFELAETKISFISYQYPLLEKSQDFYGVPLASLLDIGLMKLTAIASRGSKKDFIDLSFILDNISLAQLLTHFPEKYPIDKIDIYHYLKSLTYFEDAEEEPMPKMLVKSNWNKIKQKIEKEVRKVF